MFCGTESVLISEVDLTHFELGDGSDSPATRKETGTMGHPDEILPNFLCVYHVCHHYESSDTASVQVPGRAQKCSLHGQYALPSVHSCGDQIPSIAPFDVGSCSGVLFK